MRIKEWVSMKYYTKRVGKHAKKRFGKHEKGSKKTYAYTSRAEKNRQKRNHLFTTSLLLFSVLFLLSSAVVGAYYIESARAEKMFATLAERVQTNSDTEKQAEAYHTKYFGLYTENSDFAGWLQIDDTKIDYPVMLTPNEPEYYLYRSFDKTSSRSGTPFISADSTTDSDFFIIYGHNMKNGTMFGTLDAYANKSFWEAHPYISFTTATEERTYEIFATVETRILYQDEVGYRYYFQVGDQSIDSFDELVQWFQENACYDTGISPVYGEQILALSTCSYQKTNGRFLIVARRIDHTM